MKKLLTFLTLLTLSIGVSWAATVDETLTRDIIAGAGGPTSTSYVNWTWAFSNGTSYSGNSSAGNNAIQLRKSSSSQAKSGIISTSSVGKLKKVVVTWNSNTPADRTLNIYGKNTAYSSVSDLYGTDAGTLLGTIVCGTSTELTISDDYAYIGLCSAANSLWLDNISITWETGGGTPTEPFAITYTTPTNGSFASGNPTEAIAGDPVEITTTPDEGYALSALTVTPSATVTLNGNNASFTMPSSAVTVAATFSKLYAITVADNSGTANPTTAYEGQTVTVTPTIPDGKVLDSYTVVPSSVTLTPSGDNYTFTMPGQAVSISFTFKDKPVQSGRFVRITSTDDLEKDARYLLVCETKPAVMGGIVSSGPYGESVSNTGNYSINTTDGIIVLESESDAKPLTLGGNATDGWTFELDGNTLNQTAKNSLNTGTNNNKWTISFSGNNVLIVNKTYQYENVNTTISYNNSNPRFAGYKTVQTNIQLYKETAATTSNKLYLIGENMNSQSGWNISTGPEMTSTSNNVYQVDVIFDMADRCYFQFADGLSDSNSNWDGITGRYYASSNDGDVPVDSYGGEPMDMDGTHGLYFTQDYVSYSPGKYAFTIPAGLYTIVANKNTWQTFVTQHEVTMEIKPASATFTTTKEVTMESNLTQYGGKIYYTTDGSDPSASSTEYTGTITLEATTTIKAIAILNYIQSEVVEKTYTKAPAAPEISPASCTFNEPITVTITAENGATIYYTIDGSDPTNESTQYNGSFTVSATTTVKAIAYVGDVYSSIAEATYTYSNVQPSTGDFVLVTSADQLVPGNEYIIMTTDKDGYKLAMGDIVSSKGSWTQEFDINGTVGTAGSTVSVYSESTTTSSLVNILELENTNGQLALKQKSAGTYLNITKSNSTDISASSSKTYLTITIDENNYWATIQGASSRQILFSDQSDVFGNYATSNAGESGYEYVYLYTRATNSVQNPVFSPVPGIYNVDIDVTISCATDGATIYYTTDGSDPKTSSTRQEYTDEIIVSESTTFNAVAVKGENSSNVVTAEYVIQKSTDIETVTLDYSEPFTNGIGKFTVQNVSGFSPVWSLDGNFGVKGTSYEPATGTNHAATSRLVSPIIDMTDAVQPELTFSHQINSYFNDVTTQATLWIRETTNGTSGTWVQLPITFSDPAAAGGWTNDVVDINLTDVNGVSYAGKKVQISFLYTNPTAGSGAGTWEIQNFVVADNSEYRMVNNIAEFLALENGTKAKFRNPVTVLYDYAQRGNQEYIWVKDNSGYMQFFLQPTLNSSTESTLDPKAAYYENGDIIPAGFVVVKNYYENGKYVQAYSTEALDAGFLPATQKGLADPDHYEFSALNDLTLSDADIAANCNRYITVEKVKIASKNDKSFTFADEDGTVNACVGYNKYNGDGSLLKDGTTSADVTVPAVSNTTYYNVKGIIQIWQGGWELMPIEFTEWKADEVTLRKLCQDGVEQHTYTISNPLQVVYIDGNSVWVKDDNGQSIWNTSPAANDKNFAINYTGNTRSNQAYYDQSNWCELKFANEDDIPSSFVEGPIIKGGVITGTFTNKLNPTLETIVVGEDPVLTQSSSYNPNFYVARNFVDGNDGYFFMNPKPQEYAEVVWAMYSSSDNTMNMTNDPEKNPNSFTGKFKVNMSMNSDPNIELKDAEQTGKGYEHFHAIIRLNSTASTNDAPMLKGAPDGTEYVVYPLDITNAIVTSIDKVGVNGEVKSVKYVNVAGVVSDRPFSGVNIVVTEYTDGSRTTTKMLRK